MVGMRMKRLWLPYLLLLPTFIMVIAIIVIPLLITMKYSVQSFQLTKLYLGTPFVGLDNFIAVLTKPQFQHSLVFTIIYVLGSVVGMLLLSLVTAQIANQAFVGRNVFRAMILLPWAISYVVAGQSWKFMLQGDYGIMNHLLMSLGWIQDQVLWLVDRDYAVLSVTLANVWKTYPLMALILIGGLQTIPRDLYESSAIDGASTFKQYVTITLPLLKPFILLGLIFTTLHTLNIIDLIYVMTNGGPGEATESLTLYNYRLFFQFLNFGEGAALALLSVVVTIVLISFYIRSMNRSLDQ